jgi:hypothetical protein
MEQILSDPGSRANAFPGAATCNKNKLLAIAGEIGIVDDCWGSTFKTEIRRSACMPPHQKSDSV